MPALRLSVRQIRKLFRLKFGSLLPTSDRQIAAQLGVARSTVSEYLERAHAAGLSTGVAVVDGHVHGDESNLVGKRCVTTHPT
ncbi:hypothetical protein VH569_03330 [Azospirillum sp. 11R-A]|uniref:hypothetical protein n=1 Tax=Azospirillum sp. 11R-A TaxID=3111634 RepID=UPI003C28B7B8